MGAGASSNKYVIAARAATTLQSEDALSSLSEEDRLLLLRAKDALDKMSVSAVHVLEAETRESALSSRAIESKFEDETAEIYGSLGGQSNNSTSTSSNSKSNEDIAGASERLPRSRWGQGGDDAPPPSFNPRSYKCNTPKGGREAIPWSEDDATYKAWQEKTLKKRKVGSEAVRAAMRFVKAGKRKDQGVIVGGSGPVTASGLQGSIAALGGVGEHKQKQQQDSGKTESLEDDGSTDEEYQGLEGIYGALWAAYNGHITRLRHFIEGITETECADESGRSALFYAAARGHLSCARYLVTHKIFIIDVQDTNGDSALHVSSCYGHADVLQLLLEAGAQASSTNTKGFTPLHMSSTRECTEILCQWNCNPFAEDRNGRTPLFCACATNRYDCAAVLCEVASQNSEYFAIIDKADARGDTPMHAAVCNGHTEVLWLLISNGADPNISNARGWTPHDLAVAAGREECRKILCGDYAPPKTADRQQRAWDKLRSMGPAGAGIIISEPSTPMNAGVGVGTAGGNKDVSTSEFEAKAVDTIPEVPPGGETSAEEQDRWDRAIERVNAESAATQRPATAAAVVSHQHTYQYEDPTGLETEQTRNGATLGAVNEGVDASAADWFTDGTQWQSVDISKSTDVGVYGDGDNSGETSGGNGTVLAGAAIRSLAARPTTAPTGDWGQEYGGYTWSTSADQSKSMPLSVAVGTDLDCDAGGWETYNDPETGQQFFVNAETGEVKWGVTPKPSAASGGEVTGKDHHSEEYYQHLGEETANQWMDTAAQHNTMNGFQSTKWEALHDDDSGYTFYRNTETGECQWEVPEELKMEDVGITETSAAREEEGPASIAEEKQKGEKPDLGAIAQRLNDEFANDKRNLAKAIGFERKRQKEKFAQKLRARKAMLMLRRKRRAAQGKGKGRLVPLGTGPMTPTVKRPVPPSPQNGTPKGSLPANNKEGLNQSQLPQQAKATAALMAVREGRGKEQGGEQGYIDISARGRASSCGKVGDPHKFVVKVLDELGNEDRQIDRVLFADDAMARKEEKDTEGKQLDDDNAGNKQGDERKVEGKEDDKAQEPERKAYSQEEMDAIDLFVEIHLEYAPSDMLGTVPSDVDRIVSGPIWATFHHYAMAENPREGSSIGPNKFGSFVKECSCGPAIQQSDIDLSFQSFARHRRLNFPQFFDALSSLSSKVFSESSSSLSHFSWNHVRRVAAVLGLQLRQMQDQYEREDALMAEDKPTLPKAFEQNRQQLSQIFDFYSKRSKRRAKRGEPVALRFQDLGTFLRDFAVTPRICDLSLDKIFLSFCVWNKGQALRKKGQMSLKLSKEQRCMHFVTMDMFAEILVHIAIRFQSRVEAAGGAKGTSRGRGDGIEAGAQRKTPAKALLAFLQLMDLKEGKEKMAKSRGGKKVRKFNVRLRG